MRRRTNNRHFLAILLMALATVAMLAGCGSDPTPTPTSPPPPPPEPAATPTPVPPGVTPPPAPPPTATPDASFEAQWQQLIADCQAEGELVVAMGGSDSAVGRPMLQWFQDNYEINVVASTGSGSRNADRIIAERSRGRYTVDISQVGTSSLERLRQAEALTPIEPLIIDPTILNRTPEHWYLYDKVYWTDRDNQYSLADTLRSSNLIDVFYNTDLVSPEEAAAITSYEDLLDPKWAGKMATVGQAGSGAATTRTRLWIILGAEFFDRLYFDSQMDAVGSDNDRELADGLARGKWHIVWGGGSEPHMLIELGLPVASITDHIVMEEGLATEVRGTLSAIDQPPHPKCQQLFYNWFYSQEGQTIYQTITLDPAPSPSLRSDVPQGKVPDREWQQVQMVPQLVQEGKINVIDQGSEEFAKATDDSLARLQEIYTQRGLAF